MARLSRRPLQPHHVEALRALDAAWLEQAYARARAEVGKTLPTRSNQALTPELLDAGLG